MGQGQLSARFIIIAGSSPHDVNEIEAVVAAHYTDVRGGGGATDTPQADAWRLGGPSCVVHAPTVAAFDAITRMRGRPSAIVLEAGGDRGLSEFAALRSVEHSIPLLLVAYTPSEPIEELHAVMRVNARVVFVHAPKVRLPRRLMEFLRTNSAPCGTGRIVAALPARGDRVTQSILTHIVIGSRRDLKVADLAQAYHMTTSAVRARFADVGVVCPREMTASIRSLHALWYLCIARQRTPLVAQHMRYGSEKDVLERIRTGTGQSYRRWEREGGFDAALAIVTKRLVVR
jgi:hypothetical protein